MELIMGSSLFPKLSTLVFSIMTLSPWGLERVSEAPHNNVKFSYLVIMSAHNHISRSSSMDQNRSVSEGGYAKNLQSGVVYLDIQLTQTPKCMNSVRVTALQGFEMVLVSIFVSPPSLKQL